MLKDPAASWMRAGVHYWLGFALPILVAGAVRMAGADNLKEGVQAVGFVFGVWGAGMIGALLFGLLLLLLRTLHPCQPEHRGLSALLGAHTAGLLLVVGATWQDQGAVGAIGGRSSAWFLPAVLASALVVHALAPRAERRRGFRRRPLRPPAPLSPAEAGMTFAAGITIVLTGLYVAFGWDSETDLASRLMLSPFVAIATGLCGLAFALPFGIGAAVGSRLRNEQRLRPWHCAVSASGFALLLVLGDWLLLEGSEDEGSGGSDLGILLSLLVMPFLLGLGASLLPSKRHPAGSRSPSP